MSDPDDKDVTDEDEVEKKSRDVDEASEESFPSSDPPSTWSSAGQTDR